jgi:DNA helicase-2/ATP-dependent DNA helicase PcrA
MWQLQEQKIFLYLSYARSDKIKKMTFVASPFLKEAGMIIKESEEE